MTDLRTQGLYLAVLHQEGRKPKVIGPVEARHFKEALERLRDGIVAARARSRKPEDRHPIRFAFDYSDGAETLIIVQDEKSIPPLNISVFPIGALPGRFNPSEVVLRLRRGAKAPARSQPRRRVH